MALCDAEAVLADLKRVIAAKPHHGSRDLAVALVELEAKHHLAEGPIERALRVYGVRLSEDLRAAARDEQVNDNGGSSADAVPAHPGHRQTTHDQEVDHDGSINGSTGPQEPRRTVRA